MDNSLLPSSLVSLRDPADQEHRALPGNKAMKNMKN